MGKNNKTRAQQFPAEGARGWGGGMCGVNMGAEGHAMASDANTGREGKERNEKKQK